MERERRVRGKILMIAVAMLLMAGCTYESPCMVNQVSLSFSCGKLATRSDLPDENTISDISVMIFDENGDAEECIWLRYGLTECLSRLVIGKKYILCACANFGYRIYADHISELDEIKYHLAYPDDYRKGIPMYARMEFTLTEDMDEISVQLERLMSKISLRIDRRKLSEGVEMYVRSVQIGNCPRKVSVFSPSKAADEDDCFPSGFLLNGYDTYNLNETSESGLSREVSVYMLENMQGRMDKDIEEDSDKVFGGNDHRKSVCSYIEIDMDYTSENYHSGPQGLKYRFYLGEDRNSLNIERNCHYHIIVTPEDDGLGDDGWRVDKSGLIYSGRTSLQAYPSDYIVGNIGDKIHIWCEMTPENADFDVGESYMKDDRSNGIYDYEIDEDGHGAVLTLTGPGRGLIYMEAGSPINDAALFIIEVNQPQNVIPGLTRNLLPTDISPYATPCIPPAAPAYRQTQDFRPHHRHQARGQ